jgi:hypothetical protein
MDIFVVDLIGEDSDHDGMADDWEMAFFDSLDRDGSGDWDGDSISDFGEFKAGTVPTNSTSILAVTEVRFLETDESQITWRSVAGRRYLVQMKPTVDSVAWLDRSDVIAATGESTTFVDESGEGAPLPEKRFYRVLVVEE